MQKWQGKGWPDHEITGRWHRPCVIAFAVASALGLSGCGGGGSNVNSSTPPPPPPPAGGSGFAGGNVTVGSNDIVIWTDNIQGSIDLIKGGTGTLVLTGTGSYTGGTTINEGTLQLGNGGTTGSIIGDVRDNGSLVFDRSDDITFGGMISGSGSLEQAGKGTLTLTGTNTYTGRTTISRGTLQLGNGGTTGSITGDVVDSGTLAFDRSDDIDFAKTVTGTGSLIKTGNGVLTLTGANDYTGATQVKAGSLFVDGDQSAATGATTVASGAILGGKGTLGGAVTVADGATLAPGSNGAIGTLTINGALVLSAGSALDYSFGQANTVGGQLNDLINVNSNLVLDGTLNVSVAPGGSFGPGAYRVFNYAGTLTNNGLTLGSIPSPSVLVQTGVAHQVNLIDTQGMIFSFWDGDAGPKDNNAINGGNGTWQSGSVLSNNSWTDTGGTVNASFSDGSFAVFQVTPGTVTVDGSNGDIHVAGMQFASTGYVIQGDTIHLVGSADDPTHSIIRVGDGTTAGAGYSVIINSVLDGDSTLVKTDAGTLVLAGPNTYAGGTVVNGGTLEVASGGMPGPGNVTVDDSGNQNATLKVNSSVSLTNHVLLNNGATLDNAGVLVDNLDSAPVESNAGAVTILNHDGGNIAGDTNGLLLNMNTEAIISNGAGSSINGITEGVAVTDGNVITVSNDAGRIISSQGRGLFLWGNTVAVTNSNGGLMEGGTNGIQIYSNGGTTKITVTNKSGGVISGDGSGGYGVRVMWEGTVINDDASIKAIGTGGNGVYAVGGDITNSNNASIEGANRGIWLNYSGTVTNSNSSHIEGGNVGVTLTQGGSITNEGNSLISASGTLGDAIQVQGDTAVVSNIDGGTITGSSIGVSLQHGGTVSNGSGSTIEATGTTGGDCGGTGDCAIFVASASAIPSNPDGEMALINAGTIIGNVQMISTANNYVALSAGGSIQGDLEIGSNSDSSLVLDGGTGTTQSYSQAVTGTTTFAGSLIKKGDGTWVIDNDELMASPVIILGGALQIGDGGTKGAIGPYDVNIDGGELMFNRSDAVTFDGNILAGNAPAYYGTLVQAGTGTLTLLASHQIQPTYITIERGTLQMDNTGNLSGDPSSTAIYNVDKYELHADVVNDGSLVFNSNLNIFYGGAISGTGSVTQDGSNNLILEAANTYSGGTTINNGVLLAKQVVPGDVTVGEAGVLGRLADDYLDVWMVGVAGNLSNAGKVFVQRQNITVGGDYTQASTGTLAVRLGSKLDVAGKATLNGGTLEVTGANFGYVSNTHTNVLTALGGVNGTFGQLVKATGVVFTATTINYDANNVWLDTTGLDVTTAAAGDGVSYTPASFGSARRVQGAFKQLDDKIATGNLADVPGDFLQAAGQFQQAPTLQAAQASLQSLSGQLHAASTAMTFEAIGASSRALSDRFDHLLDKGTGYGMWTHDLGIGGDMARAGFSDVGFQLNGWLVGSDRQIGRSGVAGYAFGQSQGQQRLHQGYDHDHSRSTEGMLYAAWLNGSWYTQGRVAFGHFQQDISRQILLGESAQGVGTQYDGSYDVAHGESGLRFDRGNSHVTPFVNVEYARIGRDGFAEQGAGGFGLQSNAQTLDRWQAGLGVRAGRHWDLDDGRAVDFSARAQWQRTLASHGDEFNASFVGLQQWQPLVGIGLSRYSGEFDAALDARLSAHTSLKFDYDYERGQRDHAQMLSARLSVAF